MKLKVKIQQVLVARNCWRTNAIPKLPQREIYESSTDVDVEDIDLEISCFWLHEAYIYGFRKCLENEEVSKSKLEQHNRHNTNAADEIITAV